MAQQLSERRAADRLKMAGAIEQIAVRHGAVVRRDDVGDAIVIDIGHPHGLSCSIWLESHSIQPDVHVIPWHISHQSEARLDPSFGQVNPFHFRKATHVARGFDALAAEIDRGLAAAADGSAFFKALA